MKETITRRIYGGDPSRTPPFYSIITNCVAYCNCLAYIDQNDWEMMCAMEAFDHIYVDDDFGEFVGYDIRVSKGPWKVDMD